MKSRWILNIVLVLLILALATFVYLRPAADKPAGTPLMNLNADTVTQIRIERKERGTIMLVKNADSWRLQVPVPARANRFNVGSLLRLTTITSVFQIAANPDELAKYGLDKPAAKLTLNDEEIFIGAAHPMRQQHYIRYRDRIHLVDSHSLAGVWLNYSAFIDSQLIEEGRKLIGLRLPGLRLTLKDGVWQREPHDPKISVDSLNDFVAQWQNARALAVEKLSTTATVAQVELRFDINGKPTPMKLDILAYKPEFVIARHDERLEYHFPEETGKRLLSIDVKVE